MRPSFTLLSLFIIAAGIAWISATPAQRTALITRLFGPPPQATAPSTAPRRPITTAALRPRPAPPKPAPAQEAPRHFAAEGVGSACGGPATLAVTDVQASNVYAFVDKQGVTSFSDRRPATAATEDVSGKYRRREPYFRIKLIHDLAPDAVLMQTRIMADTQQIFMFLARHLEIDNLRQVYLDLRLLPDKASFSRYRRKHAPMLDTHSGF
jgi:hypothetical protein